MSSSLSRSVPLMLVLALTVPAAVLAQTEDMAELHGVVLDASGRPVAGYPLKLVTPLWGQVIMHPTEDDGTLVVTGLPPGTYEIRVFQPGGSTDTPIASKQLTLAAGQKEQIEIRLGSDHPVEAAASKSDAKLAAGGTTLASLGVNWTAIVIAALVLAAGLVAFFVVRSQRG